LSCAKKRCVLLLVKYFVAVCADGFCKAKENALSRALRNLVKDEFGVTAIEYALIAALIAVAAIAAFTLVGTNLSTTFSTVAAKL
jgi:pilus assembly protein Flp/PilA